jgi:hypothetical protein
MSLLFGQEGEGAWGMLCLKGGGRCSFFFWWSFFFLEWPVESSGPLVEFCSVARHAADSSRMSLLVGQKGEGAWGMLCLPGIRRKSPAGHWWNSKKKNWRNSAASPDMRLTPAG